jgi:hypothetical protein
MVTPEDMPAVTETLQAEFLLRISVVPTVKDPVDTAVEEARKFCFSTSGR